MHEDRLARLRARLEENELDAFYSAHRSTNFYLTGFTGTTSVVIVTADDSQFLCDFRYTEQAGEQVASAYTVSQVAGGMAKAAAERLNGLGVRRVGLESGTHTVAEFEALSGPLSGELTALPDIVTGLRMVKSPEEIAAIRSASELAESVLRDLLPTLEPGMQERDLAARIEYGFKQRGASGAAFDVMALFGAKSSLPHGIPGDTPLEKGHCMLFDIGCVRGMYCSDLTRTYCFGTIPGARLEEIYAVTLRAQEAALEAIRPGVACREVDAVARGIISDAGYGERFGHGLGHGVGIDIHEAPRLNQESATLLEAGMVVTVEPGIYLPGQGGVRIEDLVVVTDDGCDILTALPKQLEVL